MNHTFLELTWLFIIYSLAGWLGETAYTAIRHGKFQNRGLLNGPVCIIYGIGAIFITTSFSELSDNIFFLFLGSAILTTLVEWIAGHILERTADGKWWDYSHKRWNIDGYVCLSVSVFWGLLGVFVAKVANRYLLRLFHALPEPVMNVSLLIVLGLLVIDLLGSLGVLLRLRRQSPRLKRWNNQILAATNRFGHYLADRIARRMETVYDVKARPAAAVKPAAARPFAAGCGFYKLFLLFVIGSFLGAVVEILFCRVSGGRWMSRSSLVWGQFSVVWGLGIAVFTALLNKYRNSRDSVLFVLGTLLGGVYEYLTSVFTEYIFGAVFWDYSHLPFNLGGRINLLYCMFWGIAAVIWFKLLYPRISALLEGIPKTAGRLATWLLVAFMSINIATSMAALIRYSERAHNVPAATAVAKFVDREFPDAWMDQRYPNAKPR